MGRTPSAIILACSIGLLASPATGSPGHEPARVVAPGCAAPIDGGGLPEACGLAIQAGAAEECRPVPLVDDRCEAWAGRYAGAGTSDSLGNFLDGTETLAFGADGRTVFGVGWVDRDPGTGFALDQLTFAQDAATGGMRWSATHPGLDGLSEPIPVQVAGSPDGTAVYALSTAQDDANSASACASLLVSRDAATGAALWTAEEHEPDGGCAMARSMTVTPSGSVVVAVAMRHPGGTRSWLVASYAGRDHERPGERLWSRPLTFGAGWAVPSIVRSSPDGERIYVTGSSKRDAMAQYEAGDATVVALGADDGALLWENRIDIKGNSPAGLVTSPDGSSVYVAVGGQLPAGVDFDIVTGAFDAASGALRWTARYNGPRSQIKSSFDSVWYHGPIGLSPNGDRVFVGGYSTAMHGANLSADFVTLAYDTVDGSQEWASRYTSEIEVNWTPSLHVSPNGRNVYLAGHSRSDFVGRTRITTLAYDPETGDQRWVARYGEGLPLFAGSALSPDGRRLVVGGLALEPGSSTKGDAVTAAYDG